MSAGIIFDQDEYLGLVIDFHFADGKRRGKKQSVKQVCSIKAV